MEDKELQEMQVMVNEKAREMAANGEVVVYEVMLVLQNALEVINQ